MVAGAYRSPPQGTVTMPVAARRGDDLPYRTMSLSFEGQRVLVTGGSSGIGAGLAEAFAGRGATVGICARREDRLDQVLERCLRTAPGSRRWVVDLSVPSAVDGLAADVLEAFGGVDILVNNAGVPKRRTVDRLDPSTVEAVMNINFFSPIRLTLALLPHMLARGSGRIVNVSSIAATLSSPGEAAYDASKAALTAFSEAMAIDLWSTGIAVTVVYPGVVDTELFTRPDNDPVPVAVEPIPVSQLVEDVFAALDTGAPQVYTPGYFADIAAQKAADLPGFMAGAAAFVANRRGAPGGRGRDEPFER
jgi:NAD(P)-dependent dehydrogenase (short-subunit alcohol dehydrogenase family)